MKRNLRSFKKKIEIGTGYFASFILLDLVCLFTSNYIAATFYINNTNTSYGYSDYMPIVLLMGIVYFFVTIFFDSLNIVLRRRKRVELHKSAEHVILCFIILAAVLFSTKSGAVFSRTIVFLAYLVYFLLIVLTHTILKGIINRSLSKKDRHKKVMLMTTDRFVSEGIKELSNNNYKVTHVFLLKNNEKETIKDVQLAEDTEEVEAVLCWERIDKVFIYGIEQHMIPEALIKNCADMGLLIETVDFEYRILDIKTISNNDPTLGSLSFLEGKRDIPFPIRRVYWITETEADLHRGFHAHKQNCQLLFCPYGKIDIILDDGSGKEKTISLDEPGKGLLLMPGLWREMIWRKDKSVLCVLASEYYDENEYIRNYDEFIAYRKKIEATKNTIAI